MTQRNSDLASLQSFIRLQFIGPTGAWTQIGDRNLTRQFRIEVGGETGDKWEEAGG